MDIRGLGYIGLDVADVDAWRKYATTLGTMVVPGGSDDEFFIKVDDRPFRFVVRQTAGQENIAFAGWELPGAAALETAASELAAKGFAVEQSTDQERAHRKVRGLIRTTDPAGYVLELFWGPIHDHELFVSPTGVSGFVTGEMGLGHIVATTPDLEGTVKFYTDVLGFRVSDFLKMGPMDIVFLHCNPRHHSLALAGAPVSMLHHFMLEARTLDDVGYTLDRHMINNVPISQGLGKHTNDHMVSFYSKTPSGWDVEFGHGGIKVDDSTWSTAEITKPSFWGHRPPDGVGELGADLAGTA